MKKNGLKIDTNGYFIEDVMVDDGDTPTGDIILYEGENPISGMFRPKWDNGTWVSDATDEQVKSRLKSEKVKKLQEIKAAQNARFDEDTEVKIGTKTVTLVGGLEAYDKYTKAYEIANRMGIKKGKIVVREGVVEVNEVQMKAVLQALDTKNYRAEIKAGYLRKAVADATDEATVQSISW